MGRNCKNKKNGVEIMKDTFFFQRYGSGKPIVALHGNPGTHRDFDRIKKYIDMEEYSFLALDRVGHGRNYHLLGNDAISCYCDFIGRNIEGKFYLMGYSMGGYYGLRLAIKMVERLEGIILISPYLFARDGDKPSSIPNLAQMPIIGGILSALLPKLASSSMKKHILEFTYPVVPDEKWLGELMKEYTKRETLIATLTDKNEIVTAPIQLEELKKIECPVLLIDGEKDKKNKGHREMVVPYLKNADVRVIEDSGHGMIFTKSDIVGKEIENFL